MKPFVVIVATLLLLVGAGCQRSPKLTPDQQLDAAILNNDHVAVKQAVEKGAKLNEVDADRLRRPPLTQAVGEGNHELVKLLIELGADADYGGASRRGTSPSMRGLPLNAAVRSLDVEMVELLLKHGADASRSSEDTFGTTTPLKEVLDTVYPDRLDDLAPSDQTAAVKIIRLLVENGAQPLPPNLDAELPAVHWAARCGELELLVLLKAHGFDVNGRSRNGYTALHTAALGGHDHIVRWLLDQNVEHDVQTMLPFYWTPLHCAARKGHVSITKILLEEAGCNVNGGDNLSRTRGGTPLHVAVGGNHLEVARVLIDAGADLTLRNENKLTPLGLALKLANDPAAPTPGDRAAMIGLLREHGAPE